MNKAAQLGFGMLLSASTFLAIAACSEDGGSADPGSEDGPRRGPDGEILGPDGEVLGPDGEVLLPDGAVDPDANNKPDVSPGGEAGSSCMGVPGTCGGANDCCASTLVTGDTFNRDNDGTYPATISDFKLDVYEVTVGRFRVFVNAGRGTQANPPAAGAGLHPKIASSGWDSAWNANLAADTAALKAALACDAGYPAWTNAAAGNETKPINCVTWYDAFAFCAWDGGRLPTEAEWNYAAAGGKDQREYPWGATIPPIDQSRASYNCGGAGEGNCTFANLLPVGSKSPAGDGKYGQADLAGNVWEYTLDWARTPYRLTSCMDCADLQPAPNKTFRGGGFPNESYYQPTTVRIDDVATQRDYDVGFRCARAAP